MTYSEQGEKAASSPRWSVCQRPVKVLNLFAYTGGATLAAAAAGASVTHVDASKGMVTWAKENAVASGLAEVAGGRLCEVCRERDPTGQSL